VIQGTFGVIQGTFGVIQGTFGVIQGTFGVIQGTFGVIPEAERGREAEVRANNHIMDVLEHDPPNV
jgi:hypothetical protein